jgi:hypothetical protein
MSRLIDNKKIVIGMHAHDITGSAHVCDYVSMKNYNHLTVVITCGAWAATSAVTLTQSTSVAAGSEKALTFTQHFANADTTATDTLTAVDTTAGTFTIAAANTMYVIEVDAMDLDQDASFDVVCCKLATPGGNSDLVSVLYILSEPRYGTAPSGPTAITD